MSGHAFSGAQVAAGPRIHARCHANNALEVSRQVALVGESGRVHDVREREPELNETPRLLDADLLEILVRRKAERGAEDADQVKRAEAGDGSQLSNGDRTRVICLEQIPNAPQRGRGPRTRNWCRGVRSSGRVTNHDLADDFE